MRTFNLEAAKALLIWTVLGILAIGHAYGGI